MDFYVQGNNDAAEFDSLWRFDPLSNNWSRMTNFPGTSRKNTAYFQIDSIAYVGIGSSGSTNYFNNFYAYNMNQNTWSTIANYPGNGRRLAFCASSNGKGYVAGGVYGSNPFNYASDFWEYDPITNTWTQINTFPLGNRCNGISFSFGDEVFFGLGHNGSIDFNDLWAFNTVTRLWAQKTSFPGVARVIASSSMANGFALVGGGIELGILLHLNDYYLYDVINNTWNSTTTFVNGGKSGANGFSIGNNHYVSGGRDRSTNISDDLWEFTINSNNIQEAQKNIQKLEILPNPSIDGLLFFKGQDNFRELIIYNASGKEMYRQNNFNNHNRLDLSSLEEGMYIYTMITDTSQISGKFLLQ